MAISFIAARATDPATSQANKDAFNKKFNQRDLLLITYSKFWIGGLTDEEAGQQTLINGVSMFDKRICYWKRCSELRKLGFIQPVGETRTSSAGQQQQVCEITEQGLIYVEQTLLK